MESELISMGIISIIPAVIAIVLSFATRNTIVSLVTACIVGTLLAGQGPLAAEYIYRNYRCIFPEDRSYSELLTDDS